MLTIVRNRLVSKVRVSAPFFSSSAHRLSSSDLEEKRRRMLYHSKQRGWLELDLILGTFAEEHLKKLPEKDVLDYETILEGENPDLFKWLSGQSPVPEEYRNMHVVDLLLKHINQNHPETFQNQ
jgi:succinate dehydrogenase flavin-adding protein (antitoxin of CptAB toxin-antitoxin module)